VILGLALLQALGGGAARAAGPEVWFALHDARLAESADRDLTAAVGIYETLLTHLSPGDSFQGELLLNLARARFDAGDLEGSRAALVQASGDLIVLGRARAWRAQLDAWQRRVVGLPLVWSPEMGAGPLVLGWSASVDASLEVDQDALVWRTIVRDNRDDTLLWALSDEIQPLRSVGLQVESEDAVAHLRLIVEDSGGRRWATPIIPVQPGLQAELLISPAELLPTHSGGPNELQADQVRVIMLQDVTAFHSTTRGPNHLRISSLELR